MRVRFVNLPQCSLPLFLQPRKFVFVLDENGSWLDEWRPALNRSLFVPMFTVVPWDLADIRTRHEDWDFIRKFLLKNLRPIQHQVEGILTFVAQGKESMGLAWSAEPLIPKMASARDYRVPEWFSV